MCPPADITAVHRLSSLAELCLPGIASRPERANLSFRDGPEWETVLLEAERVGVFPAVFQRLRRSESGIGKLEGSHWERRSRSILARNLMLRQTQDELLAALESGGLRCQPIKGVRLARNLYGDLASRESFDIDLICPTEEVPAVYAELKSLGLRDLTDAWTDTGLRRALAQPEFMFPEIKLTAANGALVELHWDWTGEEFPEGDPLDDAEAYAVYLCRHAAKHFWCSLQWVCDIELLLRAARGHFDWRRFWMLAGRANAVRDCAGSLEICGELFDSAFARQIYPLSRRSARKLARRATEALADPAGREATRAHPARGLLRVDSWNRRVRRCWHWLAPAPRCFNESGAGVGGVLGVWMTRYARLALRSVPVVVRSAKWRRRIDTALSLRFSEWMDILRAGALLTRANWAVSRSPLTAVARWATRNVSAAPGGSDDVREMVYRSEKAVRLAARLHPVEMKCLPRALALAKMLAARGIAIDLKLGVRREDGGIAGHAWVEWNGEVVNESAPVAATYAEFDHSLDARREALDAARA